MDYIFPIIVLALIFSPKLVSEVKDYLLKKEQIKADTELRAEALRLKNSLELEKFINSSNTETDYNQNQNSSHSQNKANSSNIQNKANSSNYSNISDNANDDSLDSARRKRDSEYL